MIRGPKMLVLGLVALTLAGTATSAFANSNPYSPSGKFSSRHGGYHRYYHHMHRHWRYHHHHRHMM